MLSYKTYGDGEPLLLIHGFGISFDIWKNLIPYLNKDYKLVVIELPGIGKSSLELAGKNYYDYASEEIDRLRKKLDIAKWSVIAYSMGGRVAENYINQYPDCINKGVFIFPLYVGKVKATALKKLSKFDDNHPYLFNWLIKGWRLKALIILLGFNGRLNKEVKNWHYWISSQSVSSLRVAIKHLPDFGESEFNISKIPILYIWANRDMVIKKIKNDGKTIKSSHSGIITKAAEIADVIRSFVK